MTFKESIIAMAIIAASVAVGAGFARGVASLFPAPPAPQALGSQADNVLATYPTASKVFINSSDTLLVATSTGRLYLVINNISGATTTAQVISCNFGDRAATLYSGFSIPASTTVTLTLDNLYRGAIHCIAPANGALITVTDF
jgi:hypothetical protein